MINVTQTYLPEFDEYINILKRAWDKKWITNNGELVVELEQKLKKYLGVPNLQFCSNGTIVLQMALKALNITKEVITTPFSYVATTNAILWEGCTPIFVDIDPNTFCIDADKIEEAITENTQAILATHVYGLPCDVEKIQAIAAKHDLKVIYDAAHAFGCMYNGKSLVSYGDISTCSFHATKIFHTVEGGCIICNDYELDNTLNLYRSFGHRDENYYSIGINGKNSEFHAAMGLAVLPKIDEIISARKKVFDIYTNFLPAQVLRISTKIKNFTYNYSYLPVIFKDEEQLLQVKNALSSNHINTRRYFHPSLNLLTQLTGQKYSCPISERISSSVLCLPLYVGIKSEEVELICNIIEKAIV